MSKRTADIEKRTGKFISLAWFKAYDREMTEFWLDDTKPFVEQIELRVLDICHTATIHKVIVLEHDVL
jgi:hypothetical protein